MKILAICAVAFLAASCVTTAPPTAVIAECHLNAAECAIVDSEVAYENVAFQNDIQDLVNNRPANGLYGKALFDAAAQRMEARLNARLPRLGNRLALEVQRVMGCQLAAKGTGSGTDCQ